jgi:hypothetical protein
MVDRNIGVIRHELKQGVKVASTRILDLTTEGNFGGVCSANGRASKCAAKLEYERSDLAVLLTPYNKLMRA